MIKSHTEITLTPLRKDILDILHRAKKPLSAYEILAQLKKIRSNAEPPTVYRVLEFFIEHHLVHRIETENKYISCTQHDHTQHSGILFLCRKCSHSYELTDLDFQQIIKKFSQKHGLLIEQPLLEVKGTCRSCRDG